MDGWKATFLLGLSQLDVYQKFIITQNHDDFPPEGTLADFKATWIDREKERTTVMPQRENRDGGDGCVLDVVKKTSHALLIYDHFIAQGFVSLTIYMALKWYCFLVCLHFPVLKS